MDETTLEDGLEDNVEGGRSASAAEGADDSIPGDAAEMDPLEAALLERDEARAAQMRAQADYQNLRRRTKEDIDVAVRSAKAEVLGETITVLDYLDMALAAPVTSEEARNLKVGVEMTRAQLQGLFDRLSVRPIVAEGTFDPLLHQAVSTVETDEVEPGTIVEVVRGGWMMGEHVLRYAQVRVAAAPDGGAEAGPESESATADPADDADAARADAPEGGH